LNFQKRGECYKRAAATPLSGKAQSCKFAESEAAEVEILDEAATIRIARAA
jgi:hypothetical protein